MRVQTVHAEADTRERLLQVGADLFLELGYAETSLRAIAERAGMKAGSIYYHFASKDALLTEILRIGMERVTEAHEAAVASTLGADPETRLRAAIAAHLEALFAHGPFTAAHVVVFQRAPTEVREAIVPLRDAYEARWAALFEALAATGELRPTVDLGLARLTLLGAMNGALEWFDPAGTRPLEALIDQVADLAWRGIRDDSKEIQ